MPSKRGKKGNKKTDRRFDQKRVRAAERQALGGSAPGQPRTARYNHRPALIPDPVGGDHGNVKKAGQKTGKSIYCPAKHGQKRHVYVIDSVDEITLQFANIQKRLTTRVCEACGKSKTETQYLS